MTNDDPDNPTPATRFVWLQAFGVLFALIAAWSVASPIFSAPDEPAHITKAAAAVRLRFNGTTVVGEGANDRCVRDVAGPETGPVTCIYYRVPLIYAAGVNVPRCYKFRSEVPASCAAPFSGPKRDGMVASTAASNPPLYYLIVGLPTLFVQSVVGIYAMRFMAGLLCAALLALAIASLADRPRPAGVVAGLAVAVTPMTLFLCGVVNPSGLETAAAIALWASGLALLSRPDGEPAPALGWRVGVSAFALALSRPISPLWVGMIGLTLVAIAGRGELRRLWRSSAARVAIAVAAASSLIGVAWLILQNPTGGALGEGAPRSFTRWRLFLISLGSTTDRITQMIGRFGWLDTYVPAVVWMVWLGAVIVLVVLAMALGRRRDRVIVGALLIACALVPPLLDNLQAYRIGLIWQGRYLLPLAVGLPLVAGWSATGLGGDAARRVATLLVRALIVVGWVAFAAALRRYAVGTAHLLGPVRWSPPLVSPWIVVAGYAGLLVLYERLLLGRIRMAAGEGD